MSWVGETSVFLEFVELTLGAGWLHDVDRNEVFKAVSKKGFEFAYDDGDYREYAYDTAGLACTDSSAKAAKQLELSVIKRHEDRRTGKLVQSQDQSLRDFVLEVIHAASVSFRTFVTMTQ